MMVAQQHYTNNKTMELHNAGNYNLNVQNVQLKQLHHYNPNKSILQTIGHGE